MNNLAHFLDRVLHFMQPFIFLMAIVALGIAAFYQLSSLRFSRINTPTKRAKMPRRYYVSIVIFTGLIGVNMALVTFIVHSASVEVGSMLSNTFESVNVNGIEVSNPNALVSALRSMCNTPAHHSHPEENYQVLLKTSHSVLLLNLRKDSQNQNEYWVFYPGFFTTTTNDIGRVCTNTLAEPSSK